MRLKFAAQRRSGARKSKFDPKDVVAIAEEQDFVFLPMTVSHAAAKLDPPIANKDPFDEMLLIQAQEEGLRLLTVDRQLVGHPLAIAP
jgi:PIN domain nuclease of toxin-antitoxin system